MSSRSAAKARGRRPLSLAARLTLWYGLTGFVIIALVSGFLYGVLVANLDREDDEFLADKIHLVSDLLRERPEDQRMLREEVQWEPETRQHGRVYIRVLDADGQTMMETAGMSTLLPANVFPVARAGLRRADEVETGGQQSFRVMAGRVGAAVVQAALDRTREEALLARYRQSLALALAVSLVLCLLVGHGIARRGLRSVEAVARAAGRIRPSTLHERVPTEGLPAELAFLADTFNDMLGRLQDSFERLAQFSADIAHELRNPVHNLRGEAEVALSRPRSPEEYREVLESCLEECGRLSRLIDSLLFIARAEDPRTQLAREPLDLGQELAAVREFYEAAAAEGGVCLQTQVEPRVTARLDRTLLQRAVGNLVANALAHTPPGGTVTLSAARDGDGVALEVADTGEGIAPEHLRHVFDRFYRADPARQAGSGRVGLGLAMVRAIAVLHGGKASVQSEPGQGTRVLLVLPDDASPMDRA